MKIDNEYKEEIDGYLKSRGKLTLLIIGDDYYKNGNYRNMAFCKDSFKRLSNKVGKEGNSGYTLFRALLNCEDFLTDECFTPSKACFYLCKTFGIVILNSIHDDISDYVEKSKKVLTLGKNATKKIPGHTKIIHPSSRAKARNKNEWEKAWLSKGGVSRIIKRIKKQSK